MANLVALDLALGNTLVEAIAECRERGDAFCVLDPTDSPRRRANVLAALLPTHLRNEDGVHVVAEGVPVETGDGAVVVTSGSSGTPKAAVLTWDALAASAAMTSLALRRGEQDRWLATLPPHHIGGLATLLRGLFSNQDSIFGSLADGPAFGATHVSVVRTHLHRYDLSAYACVLLGGGPPPPELPSNVVTTWGMTETGSGVVYDGLALEGVRVAEREGELIVASPTLFRAYRHAPRPCVVGPDGRDDWFPTGDGATVDGQRVKVHGRLASVITTGGEKVWPEDLERLFTPTEDVNDLAVVGRADPEWGQRVCVLAVSTRNADDLLDEWRARAREHFGPWAQPKEVVVVPSIPRTANGKIQRSALT